MRLLSCHIENFGVLSDFDYIFADGLNVIKAENGWGKSTFAAFIRVMFYGLLNDAKHDILVSDRKHYLPWQGGIFGGTLTFKAQGKAYRIERTFGGTKVAGDTFALYDAETNLVSNDYSEKIGEELFAVDAVSFRRSIFIAQLDVETQMTAAIGAKIGNIADQTADLRDFEVVQERLKKELDYLTPTRKTGAIKKLQLQIAALSENIRGKAGYEEESAKLAKQLEEARKEKAAVKEELIKRQEYEAPPLELTGKGKNFIAAEAACVVFLLLGVIMLMIGVKSAEFVCAVVGIACLLFGVAAGRIAVGRRAGFKKKMLSELTERFEEKERRLTELSETMEQIKRRMEDCREHLLQIEEMEEELSRKKEEEQALTRRYALISKTKQYLEQAKTNFTLQYSRPMQDSFSYWYGILSQDEKTYEFDGDLELSVREMGRLREVRTLSEGYRNLVGLARRLSMADVMYQEEKPFLLLDDPFVNLDDARLAGGMKLLKKAAEKYQVIYFVCHDMRVPGRVNPL